MPSPPRADRTVAIKPHHLVDVVTALGAGEPRLQPHAYGHALHAVTRRLLDDPDATVEMELGADDICRPCVHNVGGLCDDVIDTSYRPAAPGSKRQWNLLIDRRWCRRLGLRQGDRLTVREFCLRLRQRAGDITGIYREIPPEMTAGRAGHLQAGIAGMLRGA